MKSYDPRLCGARLRAVRYALGMTQSAFGDLIGLSQPVIAQKERGADRIGFPQAETLLELTGIGLNWLFLGRWESIPLDRSIELRAAFDRASAELLANLVVETDAEPVRQRD